MKKGIVLITTLLTLAVFFTVMGCSRSDDYYYGNATFYSSDPTLSNIRVVVDGNRTDYITSTFYPNYCNTSGFANFYLEGGQHYYNAETVSGPYYSWSNTFYVDQDCFIINLQ